MHNDKFVTQSTALMVRYVLECRRQIDLGGRSRIAYDMVCPNRRSNDGAAATATALVEMLQGTSNNAWKMAIRAR